MNTQLNIKRYRRMRNIIMHLSCRVGRCRLLGAILAACISLSFQVPCETREYVIAVWGDGAIDTFYREPPGGNYSHTFSSYGVFDVVFIEKKWQCPCLASDTVRYTNIDCDDQNDCTIDQCIKGNCKHANATVSPDPAIIDWWKKNCCCK